MSHSRRVASTPFFSVQRAQHPRVSAAQARLFTGVQTIAWRKDRVLIREMHAMRDEMGSTPSGQEVCALPKKFGSIASAGCESTLAEVRDKVFNMQLDSFSLQEFDKAVCLPVVQMTARLALTTFTDKLRALFPGAVEDISHLSAAGGLLFALLVGPLKGTPRALVKLDVCRKENNDSDEWLFTTKARAMWAGKVGAFG